jgi:hypothetical protein
MNFFKFLSNLFVAKKEETTEVITPQQNEPQVENITQRLRDVSTRSLVRVESVEDSSTSEKKSKPKKDPTETNEKSVKEIKSKSTTNSNSKSGGKQSSKNQNKSKKPQEKKS